MPVVVCCLQSACVCNSTATLRCGFTGAIVTQFHIMGFARIAAAGAVMVIAAGNGVVKEDIAAKLRVHRAYLPGL